MRRLLAAAAVALVAAACTPAQVAVFNDYQAGRGWPTFTQADATQLWCGSTPAQRVAWLGWDTITELHQAGATPACATAIAKAVVDVPTPTSAVGVNAVRAAAGVPALVEHWELSALAQAWSRRMADAGSISHANPISAGLSASWVKLGENVGVGASVDVVLAAMVASPLHYANMVDPAYNRVGVGVVSSGGRVWVTIRFMQE